MANPKSFKDDSKLSLLFRTKKSYKSQLESFLKSKYKECDKKLLCNKIKLDKTTSCKKINDCRANKDSLKIDKGLYTLDNRTFDSKDNLCSNYFETTFDSKTDACSNQDYFIRTGKINKKLVSKRDIPININLKRSQRSKEAIKDEQDYLMFQDNSNSTIFNEKSLNQDLSRNMIDIEKYQKIKIGTFCTEAFQSTVHFPCREDIPESFNRLINLAQTFDENETINADISNLHKAISKEKISINNSLK